MPAYAWVIIGIFVVIVVLVGIVYSIRDTQPSHGSYHSPQKAMTLQKEAQMKYWIMKLNFRTGEANPLLKARGPFDTREKATAVATEMDESFRNFEELLRAGFTAGRKGQSQFSIPDSASTQKNSGYHSNLYRVLSDSEIEASQAAGIRLERFWIVCGEVNMNTMKAEGGYVYEGPFDTEEEAETKASEMNKWERESEDEREEQYGTVIRRRYQVLSDSGVEDSRASGRISG